MLVTRHFVADCLSMCDMIVVCRFTHDAIRLQRDVWLCNTGEGQLIQMAYPTFEVVRTLKLFTSKDHINTVSAFDTSSVWAVLHMLGKVRFASSLWILLTSWVGSHVGCKVACCRRASCRSIRKSIDPMCCSRPQIGWSCELTSSDWKQLSSVVAFLSLYLTSTKNVVCTFRSALLPLERPLVKRPHFRVFS
jgi:hypothetical protein